MDPQALALRAVEEHKAAQKWPELAELIERLDGVLLDNILEIGTQEGGTFWLWRALAGPDAWILGLDVDTSRFEGSTSAKQSVITADSHKHATEGVVMGFFEGQSIDLLFIDGDHTYEGVKQDYEAYGPMVRDGGLVVFHDIAPHPAHQSEVHRFWAQLEGDKWESIYPGLTNLWNGGVLPIDSCGIGVLRVV